MDQSQKFTLSQTDWKKIGKGALIAVGGALLTYVAQALTHIDFGSYSPIVMTVSTVIVNAGQKFLAGESQ